MLHQVGITASSDVETISCILNETGSSVVVCSTEKLSVFIKLVNNGTTTGVKHIIIMDMKEVREGRKRGGREGEREGERDKEFNNSTIFQLAH